MFFWLYMKANFPIKKKKCQICLSPQKFLKSNFSSVFKYVSCQFFTFKKLFSSNFNYNWVHSSQQSVWFHINIYLFFLLLNFVRFSIFWWVLSLKLKHFCLFFGGCDGDGEAIIGISKNLFVLVGTMKIFGEHDGCLKTTTKNNEEMQNAKHSSTKKLKKEKKKLILLVVDD